MPPPANQAESYRAKLHHITITYCRMQTYLGQMYHPANWTECYRAGLHSVSVSHMRESHMYWANRKSYLFWYRLICLLLILQYTSIMQDPQRRQPPPRNSYHGWTAANWHKSLMQPYINMRPIASPHQFTHILPLAVSFITTPRYYFQGTGTCTPHYIHLVAKTSTTWSHLYICLLGIVHVYLL